MLLISVKDYNMVISNALIYPCFEVICTTLFLVTPSSSPLYLHIQNRVFSYKEGSLIKKKFSLFRKVNSLREKNNQEMPVQVSHYQYTGINHKPNIINII